MRPAKKQWLIRESAPESMRALFSDYNPVFTQLLFSRGLTTREQADAFLAPNYQKNSHDPYLFSQMEAGVQLVIDMVRAHEPIVIYGDYDADGVTSSSVLFETLGVLKGLVTVYIPDRVSEGYGLNREAINDIHKAGAKLIITVDNGIRSQAEVDYAQSLGLKVIITDHHVAPESAQLPNCIIINPMVPTETYPFKQLAGVGVASKFAMAIIQKTKLDDDLKLRLEERILDLTAIGTVADCMPLLGENRVLVKKGLEIINRHKRLGLSELFKVAKINIEKPIDAWNLGFQIAPRLNAAGRLGHANTAFELLTTNNQNKANTLASELNDSNISRQKITEDIVKKIIAGIDSIGENEKMIVAVNPDNDLWNEGVIGLAAGRISERFHLPTLVISGENQEFKGSGRSSVESINLIEVIESAKDFTVRYGGHKSACGFSISGLENLNKFISAVKAKTNELLADLSPKPILKIETELDFNLLNDDFVNHLEAFAPHGEGNPRPLFVSTDLIVADLIKMGDASQHLKLRLRRDQSGIKNALGFGLAPEWPELKIGDMIDLVYTVEMNEFQGRREVQLRIIDLKIK